MSRDRKAIWLPFGWEIHFWHLEDAQLSYTQHLKRAFGFAIFCGLACIKALIHGLIPCWFEDTTEEVLEYLEELNEPNDPDEEQ